MKGWHSLDVQDQNGRRVVVTGANTGLGFQTSLALAGAGAEVIMAVRDLDRGQDAAGRIRDLIEEPKLRVLHLDLADLGSVRHFAAEQVAAGPLDLLINNAGLMLVPRRELTNDGFESQMGVNHLGHFALTAGLMPALLAGRASRVVSVTSIAARRSRRLDHNLSLDGRYTPMVAYSQSKLAVALFAEELDRRLQAAGSGMISVLAHPGWSATAVQQPGDEPGLTVRIGRRATAILGSSPRSGASSQVYAGTAGRVMGGELVGPRFLARGTPHDAKLTAAMTDPVEAEWLWRESVRLTGTEPRPIAGADQN